MEWSNQDKIDWILEKSRIKIKKVDSHITSDDYRAEQMQKDIQEMLVEYFDENWKNTAYEEDKVEYIEDGQSVIDDIRYSDEIDKRMGL
jgi:phosphohistidine phosphatase SixA